MFMDITCKLGNMRKAVEWTICPQDSTTPNEIVIQADKRIAKVFLDKGKAILSDGKGGHPGYMKLLFSLGATVVDVPSEVIQELKDKIAKNPQVGPIRVL